MIKDRHPAVDNAVFGAALILALIVAYYGVKKVFFAPAAPARPAVEGTSAGGETQAAEEGPVRELESSPTERAVSSLPPIRLMRTGMLRPVSGDVPPPDKK